METLRFKLSAKGEAMSRKLSWKFKPNKVYTALSVNPEGDIHALNENGANLILMPQWFDVVEAESEK